MVAPPEVPSTDRSSPPTVARRRGRRVAVALAKGVALLLALGALLYLAGVNLFLGTHLFRDAIGADPDSLLVDYTSAYSPWPGRIHAEGLSIRGRDSHVEWILRIDRVDLDVSFTDLAHQKFHTDHVRADGVSLRVRRRVDRVTPETLSALPPVPGFDHPPLRDVGPPSPPLTDATYDLWTIELDDVVATRVHEVWIDTIRGAGDLQVRGRWLFRPLRWLDVGPATVDVHALDVSFGTIEPWASGVVGRLGVTVHPFNLETVASAAIVDQVSVLGDLEGTAEVANVVNRATEGDGVTLTHALARFGVRANLDHGVLRPGASFLTEPFDARATARGFAFEASLQAALLVDPDHLADLDLRVAGLQVSAVSGGGPARARVASLAATFTSRHVDLGEQPFSDPAYAVEVDGAETDSLASWRARLPLPADLEITSGPATAGGRLEGGLRERTGKGHVTFAVRGLSVAHGVARVGGDLTASVHLDGSLETRRVDLSGSRASLHDVRATVKGVSLDASTIDAHTADLVLAGAKLTGHVAVEAPAVHVPSLATLGALLSLPADVAIEGGRGTAEVRMDVDVAHLAGSGTVSLAAHDLRLRIGAQRLQGDLTVALVAKQHDAATELSGSQIAFQSSGAPGTLDWWGRVRLRQATLDVQPGLRFRSHVSSAFKDGSPLTALVVDNTALPQWLLDVVSTKALEATGQILVTPSLFAVRSVEAHAKGADLGFEFGKIRQATKEWALLLDLGVALVGVDVANGHTQVLLFGARPWFQEKVAALEAVERGHE